MDNGGEKSHEKRGALSIIASNDDPAAKIARHKEKTKLQQFRKDFDTLPAEPFKPGDIVEWKPNSRCQSHPLPGKMAVIMEIGTFAFFEQQSSAHSATARAVDPTLILDVIMACEDQEGDVVRFAADSRYFQLAE